MLITEIIVEQIIEGVAKWTWSRPEFAEVRDLLNALVARKKNNFEQIIDSALTEVPASGREYFTKEIFSTDRAQRYLTDHLLYGSDSALVDFAQDLHVHFGYDASVVRTELKSFSHVLRQYIAEQEPQLWRLLITHDISSLKNHLFLIQVEMQEQFESLDRNQREILLKLNEFKPSQAKDKDVIIPPGPFPPVPLVLSPEQKKLGPSKSRIFISYKRGTDGVQMLLTSLRARKYITWFDRDEILLGDTNWQAKIKAGIWSSSGLIVCITPEACNSKPIQHEIAMAKELNKPIFPILLEPVSNWGDALVKIGLDPLHHVEDFTEFDNWESSIQRLLRGFEAHDIVVTRHELRRRKTEKSYRLHQRYLLKLVDDIGSLNIIFEDTDLKTVAWIEEVYIDSPTYFSLGLELQDWHVINWWINYYHNYSSKPTLKTVEDLGLDRTAFDIVVDSIEVHIDKYRQQYPDVQPNESFKPWSNGKRPEYKVLQLQDIVSACDRLVILGPPGSGKSTFVKFLLLCLAGEQIDGWERSVNLNLLPHWPHGNLTPIYIEMRRFVTSEYFPKDIDQMPVAEHLWKYIESNLVTQGLHDYAPELLEDLEQGSAIVVFDGLDEVPFPEFGLRKRQQQLQSLFRSIESRFPKSRLLVTSRPYAYDGWHLENFFAVPIAELKEDHRKELAKKLIGLVGTSAEKTDDRVGQLLQQLQSISSELKDQPLFLTLMVMVFLQNQGLPTQRARLYKDCINILLYRWTHARSNQQTILDIIEAVSLDDLLSKLSELAYNVYERSEDGVFDIGEEVIYKYLKPMGRQVAVDLIPYLSQNAGVLVSPGQNSDETIFRFAHRSFQEYLASKHLAQITSSRNSYQPVFEKMNSMSQYWREPCRLLADILLAEGRKADYWLLLEDLIPTGEPESNENLGAAWLAAQVVMDHAIHPERRSEMTIARELAKWLSEAVTSNDELSTIEIFTCSTAMGILGDPRQGVGTRNNKPDMGFCYIPPGEFLLGSAVIESKAFESVLFVEHPVTVDYGYWIGLYPVTVEQWELFAQQTGYNVSSRNNANAVANFPIGRIRLDAALAFCDWLNNVADDFLPEGYKFALPSEIEWEKAAKGGLRIPQKTITEFFGENKLVLPNPELIDNPYPHRSYPWGGATMQSFANTSEVSWERLSAVGSIKQNVSPYGAFDLSGNIWEWTRSVFRPYPYDPVDGRENTTDLNERFVMRGGSFMNDIDLANIAFRLATGPRVGFKNYGFRVAIIPKN